MTTQPNHSDNQGITPEHLRNLGNLPTNPSDDEIDKILDKIADYLPDECSSLNHNDLPETKAAIQAYVQQETDKAYEQGRIAEAKTCEQARRHDVTQAVLRGRIDELEKLRPEFEMVPMIAGWKPFPWATMKPEDQAEAKQWQAIHSHAALYYEQFIKDRLAALKAKGATHE